MKSKLIQLCAALSAFMLGDSEVIAYFTDPSAGATAAYKEGNFLMAATPPANLTVATEGKQVLISLGTKAQILAFSSGPSDPNPHWFAPDRNWLNVVFNNGAATPNATAGLDLDNSDLVFGTGQTVVPTFDLTKVIPFKKVGITIKYDATLGGSTAVTVVSGLGVNNVAPAPPVVPGAPGTPGAGTPRVPLANAAKGYFASLPMWSWFLIVPIVGFGVYKLVAAILPKKGKKAVSK